MFTHEEIQFIQKMVADLVGRTYPGEVTVAQGIGLSVKGDEKQVTITAESKPALARGFFRLAQEMHDGKTAFDFHEEKQFESCGAFVDFSRNAVMTVEACKRYMHYLAALGMNLLSIYIEDTYEIPGYPYMGYLRGRLSQQELRELDQYAQSLGIELLPSIQTLAHLENYLHWSETRHLRDQPQVLLVDEPETYELIEAMIKSMRECVSTRRLHIGMDEAHGVGLGQYFAKHGITNRFELLNRHLTKVVEICEKYDFHPIMWSDMFFRLGSKTNQYYDPESYIPQSVIDDLPNVDLCYWDYYNKEESMYEHMFAEHERMNPNTVFAGGVWTWAGFLPQVERTRATMGPGLKVAARHNVKTVLATQWGDNGNECDQFLAISQLPMFSEFCWRGACDDELVASTGEFLTGLHRDAYKAFGMFFPDSDDHRPGKALIYCDPLFPMGPQGEELEGCIERYAQARELLKPHLERDDCRYADALFDVAMQKALLIRDLRTRYLAGDKPWLAQTAEETIPALIESYAALRDLHKAQWEKNYKRNGWNVMALRYGAVCGRLEDVADALLRYVNGTLDTICELDEEPLKTDHGWWFASYATPMYSL